MGRSTVIRPATSVKATDVEEYFPGSPNVDEIMEKSEACERWGEELEDAANDVQSFADEVEELEKELGELESTEKSERAEEIEQEIEGKLDEAREKAEEASGSLEL